MKRKTNYGSLILLTLGLVACGSGQGSPGNTKTLGYFRYAQSCEEILDYARDFSARSKKFPDRVVPVAQPFASPNSPTLPSAGSLPEAADDSAAGSSVLQSDLAFPDTGRGLIYALGQGKKSLKVFRVSPISAPQLLGQLDLDFYPREAVAVQARGRDYVALFGDTQGSYTGIGPEPLPAQVETPPLEGVPESEAKSVMALIDVTSPETPQRLREEQSPGFFLEARALPDAGKILWVSERYVPIYLDRLTDDQIIPQKNLSGPGGGSQAPMLDCQQTYLYENPSVDDNYAPYALNSAIVSILDLTQEDAKVASQAIYSPAWRSLIAVNPQRLFLAQSVDAENSSGTELYQFELASKASPLALSAAVSVPGEIPNQFFLDEKDGVLRVFHHVQNFSPVCIDDCSAPGSPGVVSSAMKAQSEATGNYLSTYRKSGEGFELLGRSGPFETDETPYAARFVGELGCVITFRQIDPLSCFDLKNPAQPSKLGELQIEGVSFHLESVGQGLLLGIGQGATGGSVVANLFDIRNPSQPTLAQQLTLSQGGEWSYSPVFYDYRALGKDESLRNFAVPYEDGSGSSLALFSVDPAARTLTAKGKLQKIFSEQGPYDSFLRAYFFQDSLATLSTMKLEVFSREDLSPAFSSPLGE